MKPPKGLFWAWTDIGSGFDWYLCKITGSASEPMIAYLSDSDGFEDYWYDDDWDEDEIIPIEKPKPLRQIH